MSQPRKFNSTALTAIAAILAFAADQTSKTWIQNQATNGSFVQLVLPPFLRWNYTQNFHGAFGMFGSNGALLIGMAVVVLVIFWLSFRSAASQSRLVCIAFGMIVGGAIGNIADRVHFGYVIDFIDFYKIWPDIFNVGDSCITIGVVLLLLSSLGKPRRHAA